MPELKCMSTVPKDGTLVALVRRRGEEVPRIALMRYVGSSGFGFWRTDDQTVCWTDAMPHAWIEPEAFSNGIMPGRLVDATMWVQ